MTVWADPKAELTQLLDEQPGALTGYPDPRSDNGRDSPIAISLAAWAAADQPERPATRGHHDRRQPVPEHRGSAYRPARRRYTGLVFTSRVGYRVAPEATERIPLLIGTASAVPELGYAVPPGTWVMRVELDLGYDRAVRTPALPITIAA